MGGITQRSGAVEIIGQGRSREVERKILLARAASKEKQFGGKTINWGHRSGKRGPRCPRKGLYGRRRETLSLRLGNTKWIHAKGKPCRGFHFTA